MKVELSRRATYDLHLHSCRSDGRLEPDALLERAAGCGLDVIALTDHDLTGALDPGLHRVGGREIRVIAGAELTGVHEGREYHLLVYFPGEPPAAFRDLCASQARARAVRYDRAVARLGLPGVAGAPAAARSGDVSVTRHHLGRALVAAGHAPTVHDAFARLLTREVVPTLELPYTEAIRQCRAMGGVTSWAHPPAEALRAHLATFAGAGLHAIEGARPAMRREDRVFARKAAKLHGVFLTGGSDWHGWGGTDLGLFRLRGEDLDPFLVALAA
jgi:3',5'-nucleoside bisphosphate phosphatase